MEWQMFLKGFLIWSLVGEKLNSPVCSVCLSRRGVNEWGMNNAGQDPIVWRGPITAWGAVQETLWNIDSPLKSCCVDVTRLVGCEWRFFFCFSWQLKEPPGYETHTHQLTTRWRTSVLLCVEVSHLMGWTTLTVTQMLGMLEKKQVNLRWHRFSGADFKPGKQPSNFHLSFCHEQMKNPPRVPEKMLLESANLIRNGRIRLD